MALSFFQNTFAGNPLDRASERRVDAEWLARQLASPDSLGIALWNGKPFIEKTKDGGCQIAYLPAKLVGELAGGNERLLFMGLWKDTAIFALDMEGSADPGVGPLQGLGEFKDLRQVAMQLPATEAAICSTAKAMFEWRRKHQYCAACGQPSERHGWRLEAQVPVLRGRALPAHRPGGDHAGLPRRALHAGPPGDLARRHVLGPGRLPGARREHRGGLRPRTGRGGRPAHPQRRATTPPSRGPIRHR